MKDEDTKFLDIIRKECPNIKHAAEIGVYYSKDCVLAPLIEEGVRVTLVEPLPECVVELKAVYGAKDNVRLFPVAIGYEEGQVDLMVDVPVHGNPDAAASSYVLDAGSPFATRTGADLTFDRAVRVECVTFDTIDTGDIDAIHIDVEGLEWAVISKMISRPKVISVEMYGPNEYVNPHEKEIKEWLKSNGYVRRTVCRVEYPQSGTWIDTDEIYVKES